MNRYEKYKKPYAEAVNQRFVSAEPLAWWRGPASVESIELPDGSRPGLLVLDHRGGERLKALPVEFIAHQIKDLNPADADELLAFAEKWGLVLSPARFDDECAFSYGDLARRNANGIRETDEAIARWPFGPDSIEIVSLAEMRAGIELLQATWARFERAASSRECAHDLDPGPFAAASCSPLHLGAWIPTREDIGQRSNLVRAICNQLIATVADETPWKICANVKCGRLFKRKQGKRENPDNRSKYCSDRCLEQVKKREYRARKAKL